MLSEKHVEVYLVLQYGSPGRGGREKIILNEEAETLMLSRPGRTKVMGDQVPSANMALADWRNANYLSDPLTRVQDFIVV